MQMFVNAIEFMLSTDYVLHSARFDGDWSLMNNDSHNTHNHQLNDGNHTNNMWLKLLVDVAVAYNYSYQPQPLQWISSFPDDNDNAMSACLSSDIIAQSLTGDDWKALRDANEYDTQLYRMAQIIEKADLFLHHKINI